MVESALPARRSGVTDAGAAALLDLDAGLGVWQGDYEDGVAFGGYSTVIAPDGAFLARGEHFEEGLVTATINPEALRFKRRSLPLLRDERPEVVLRELERIVGERYS